MSVTTANQLDFFDFEDYCDDSEAIEPEGYFDHLPYLGFSPALDYTQGYDDCTGMYPEDIF